MISCRFVCLPMIEILYVNICLVTGKVNTLFFGFGDGNSLLGIEAKLISRMEARE